MLTLSPARQSVHGVAGGRVLCFELPELPHKSIDVGLAGVANSPPLKVRLRAKGEEVSVPAAELISEAGSAAHLSMALPAKGAVLEVSTLASPSTSNSLTLTLVEINGVMQLVVTVMR